MRRGGPEVDRRPAYAHMIEIRVRSSAFGRSAKRQRQPAGGLDSTVDAVNRRRVFSIGIVGADKGIMFGTR